MLIQSEVDNHPADIPKSSNLMVKEPTVQTDTPIGCALG